MSPEELKALPQSAFFVHTRESSDNGEYQCLECGATKDYGGEHYNPAGKDTGPTNAICPACYAKHPTEPTPEPDGWQYGLIEDHGEVIRWKGYGWEYQYMLRDDRAWSSWCSGSDPQWCRKRLLCHRLCTRAEAEAMHGKPLPVDTAGTVDTAGPLASGGPN